MKSRLSKFLSNAGIGSRRTCEKLIYNKRITVNGKIITQPYFQIDPLDSVLLDKNPVHTQKKHYYLMLNKPKGYVCSHKRRCQEKLVYDLAADIPARLFSLGRLDKNTQGLIILTNDGSFAHKVIHPSSHVSKEYLVKTSSEISSDHLKTISHGCKIQGKWVTPKRVVKVRRGTLKIVVQDGLKHEVRLLVAHAGLNILELKRIRIGGLCLNTLREGSYLHLNENHLNQIFH